MIAKRLPFLLLLLFILAGWLHPAAEAAPVADAPRTLLADLVAEVLTANPEIKADEAGWDAYREQARQAGALEDPMLMARLQNLLLRDPLNFERDSTSAKVIGISQKLPFFGKRDLARQVAEQEAEAAAWQVAERRLELAGLVRELWPQLLLVDQSLLIVAQNIAALDDLARLGETRYGAGRGEAGEVIGAQLERARMEELRLSLQQQRQSLTATLNALRLQPAATPIIPAAELALRAPELDPAALEELAFAKQPRLKALAVRQEAAQTRQQQAQREFFPDFTLSVEYMQRDSSVMDRDGFDMYSAGISFNLPLQRERRHAMSAEAAAGERRAKAEQEALRSRIRLGIADGLARLESARQRTELYRQGLIPQTEHALAAALAAYRAGRGDFRPVLESRAALFNFQRQQLAAIAEHQIELARLATLIGAEL